MHFRNELLASARTSKGKRGRDVAHLVGVTESMVSKLENGHLPVTDEMIGRYYRAGLLDATQVADALRTSKDAA